MRVKTEAASMHEQIVCHVAGRPGGPATMAPDYRLLKGERGLSEGMGTS